MINDGWLISIIDYEYYPILKPYQIANFKICLINFNFFTIIPQVYGSKIIIYFFIYYLQTNYKKQ